MNEPVLKFPEYIPVLEPKDFCRHTYGHRTGEDEQHCLMGWAGRLFCDDPSAFNRDVKRNKEFSKLKDAFVVAILDRGVDISHNYINHPAVLVSIVVPFNDNTKNRKYTLCSVWNRVTDLLGYKRVKGQKYKMLQKLEVSSAQNIDSN